MIEDADGDIQATELGQLVESHLTPQLFGLDPRAHRATHGTGLIEPYRWSEGDEEQG
jgi:hypothetical protein